MENEKSSKFYLESSEYYSNRYRTPIVKLIIPVVVFMMIVFLGSLFFKIDNTIDGTGIVVQNDHYRKKSTVTIESLISANQSIVVKKGQYVSFNVSGTDKFPTSMRGKVVLVTSKPIVKNSHIMYKISSKIRSRSNKWSLIRAGIEGKLSIHLGKISVFDAIKQGGIPK